jgi:DNA mismatch endonuclease, patch repair protein
LLFSKGLRYRIHTSLPGKPDIVFTRKKVCVFINGCFWHMHKGCKHFVVPKTNTLFWMNKIQSNIDRDARNHVFLEKEGWQPVVIWECMIELNPASAVQQILEKIK